jgi:hypothetical protein
MKFKIVNKKTISKFNWKLERLEKTSDKPKHINYLLPKRILGYIQHVKNVNIMFYNNILRNILMFLVVYL